MKYKPFQEFYKIYELGQLGDAPIYRSSSIFKVVVFAAALLHIGNPADIITHYTLFNSIIGRFEHYFAGGIDE